MRKIIFIAFIAIPILLSCNANKSSEMEQKAMSITDANKDKVPQFGTVTDSAGITRKEINNEESQQKQPIAIPPPNPDWDKKIIKNASLNLEVKDYNSFNGTLREKARSLGGYVAQEEQTQTEYKIENTVIIRVPVDQFDQALATLTTNVTKINERKITSQDVTGEYVDTKSRMAAKRQVRERYMQLLQQARNMEEILNVQSYINGIQEEIESAEGRIQYLGHASAYSTIELTFYQVIDASAKNKDEPSFAIKLSKAFRVGGSWIVDLVVGLVSVWPLLLLIFAGYLIYRKNRPQKSRAS